MAFKIIKVIIFWGLPLFSNTMIGQGNLQFNRTRFIEKNITPQATPGGFFISDSLDIIVPPNKTLKIESANAGTTFTQSGNIFVQTTLIYISLNGSVLYWNSPSNTQTKFPIWLPEGTYKLRFTTVPGNIGGNLVSAFVTALEFNIIP